MGSDQDKKLADGVVALGVGCTFEWGDTEGVMSQCWAPDSETSGMDADKFVRDWRVAGALMEKCQKVYAEYIGEPEQTAYARAENNRTWEWPTGESLPRTIIEACVEALSPTESQLTLNSCGTIQG